MAGEVTRDRLRSPGEILCRAEEEKPSRDAYQAMGEAVASLRDENEPGSGKVDEIEAAWNLTSPELSSPTRLLKTRGEKATREYSQMIFVLRAPRRGVAVDEPRLSVQGWGRRGASDTTTCCLECRLWGSVPEVLKNLDGQLLQEEKMKICRSGRPEGGHLMHPAPAKHPVSGKQLPVTVKALVQPATALNNKEDLYSKSSKRTVSLKNPKLGKEFWSILRSWSS